MSITPMASSLFIADCSFMPSAVNAPCSLARMARGNRRFSSCSPGYCPCSMACELGHNVRTGYFSQNRIDVLNPSHTVLDSARDMANPVSEQTARTVLGSFLFGGDDVFKTVAVLSGGEKSRLALVRLLLDPPNLLLM